MRLRLTLRELELFCAIAKHGSVRRAAEAVALTQSATSQALARLEQALDAPLFDRRGRRLVLNEAGRLLLPRAQRLLDDAQALQGLLAGAPMSIHLGASTTIANYLLPQLLAELRRREPAAQVRLSAGNTAEVVAAVAAMRLDFGLIEGPCRHPQLQVTHWRDDELVPIAPPGHALAQGRVRRQQLAAARWLLRESGSGTRDEVERWLLLHVGEVRADMELGDNEAIKRAVAAGVGISCLPRLVVADLLASGALAEIDTGLPPLVRPLSLVRHAQRPLSPSIHTFLGC